VRRWLEGTIEDMARYLELQSSFKHFKNDLVSDGNDLIMNSCKKRNRMDQTLQLSLGKDVIGDNRAKTTAGYLRAHPDIGANTSYMGMNIDDKFVRTYNTVGWLTYGSMDVIGLCYDGVRSGMPATEDIATCLSEPNMGGHWLSPVASNTKLNVWKVILK
jgi:hypothetical protein